MQTAYQQQHIANCRKGCLPTRINPVYNLGQNVCRLFHFLAQFVSITSETELACYDQNMNVRVTSRVAEQRRI